MCQLCLDPIPCAPVVGALDMLSIVSERAIQRTAWQGARRPAPLYRRFFRMGLRPGRMEFGGSNTATLPGTNPVHDGELPFRVQLGLTAEFSMPFDFLLGSFVGKYRRNITIAPKDVTLRGLQARAATQYDRYFCPVNTSSWPAGKVVTPFVKPRQVHNRLPGSRLAARETNHE